MKPCIACGTQLTAAAKFCVRCGISQESENLIGGGASLESGDQEMPLFTGRKSNEVTGAGQGGKFEPKLPAAEFVPPQPKKPREPVSKKTKITLASAMAVLLAVVGIVVVNTSPVSLKQAFNGEQLTAFAKESCSALDKALESPMSFETYNKRLTGLRKQTQARPAKRFVDKYDWTAKTFAPDYESSVSLGILEIVTSKANGLDISPDRINLSEWATDFTPVILEACKAQSDYDDTVTALTDLDAETARVVALAATAPWYPVGFTEDSTFEGFAYKNHAGGSCGYYTDGCASFKLVTNKYCASLYVEVGFDSASGIEVDYGNDLRYGVFPGRQQTYVINHYSYLVDTWDFKKIDCY